jgi:hypothetical protein
MMVEAEAPKVVSIFVLAFFSFWSAIPAGLALGLSPLAVIATTTLGYISGVAVVLLPGERVRAWVLRRFNRQAVEAPPGVLRRVWERWGVVGLGLLGPMTVGAQLGTALGVALNAGPRALFVWMALGALVWSVLLTLAVALGVLGAQAVL